MQEMNGHLELIWQGSFVPRNNGETFFAIAHKHSSPVAPKKSHNLFLVCLFEWETSERNERASL